MGQARGEGGAVVHKGGVSARVEDAAQERPHRRPHIKASQKIRQIHKLLTLRLPLCLDLIFAGALRVLLRYLRRQEIIATDLSRAVPRGRTYKQAAIPRAIPWSDVERVLASVDRRSACGKRDYAVLMLFATYGLRAQEVAALELSAIDWPQSKFHVLGRKAGNAMEVVESIDIETSSPARD